MRYDEIGFIMIYFFKPPRHFVSSHSPPKKNFKPPQKEFGPQKNRNNFLTFFEEHFT